MLLDRFAGGRAENQRCFSAASVEIEHLRDGAGDGVEAALPMRCPRSQLSSMKRITDV